MSRLVLLVALLAACTPSGGGVVRPTAEGGSAAPTASARVATPSPGTSGAPRLESQEYPVGRGQGPHDVAPAADGGVWYTAQRTGELGHLDPKTGATRMVKLGAGSAPHGVIVGPDGAPWITDSGLNAIVRVDPKTSEVRSYPLGGPTVDLNTAVFDRFGDLWFTGQRGYYGKLDVRSGTVRVLPAPRGPGPYGIASCDDGFVYYASLAGSHIARVDPATGEAFVIDPPTKAQGARRVWCGEGSSVWVSEWNAGQVGRYVSARPEPTAAGEWREWKLPGANPMAYAVYVDDRNVVWLSDFGANAIVRFDPRTDAFTALPFPSPNAAVRQLHGRPGEVWGAMSGQDKLVVVRTR